MYYIIVACTEDGGISNDGKIPWNLKKDINFFKDITIGNGNNAVIMGRKTYFSIPEKYRPLNKRLNIVVTRTPEKYKTEENVIFVNSYESAFEHVHGYDNIFNIGGKQIYEKGFEHFHLNGIYLTRIKDSYETDDETKCPFFTESSLDQKFIKHIISYDKEFIQSLYINLEHLPYYW